MSGAALHTVDITARPVGANYGGKHGSSVQCPACRKPALKVREGWSKRNLCRYAEYAHRLSFTLDEAWEPKLHVGDVCRVELTPDGSPMRPRRSVGKGRK